MAHYIRLRIWEFIKKILTKEREVHFSYRINAKLVTKKVHLWIVLFSTFKKVSYIHIVSVTLELTVQINISVLNIIDILLLKLDKCLVQCNGFSDAFTIWNLNLMFSHNETYREYAETGWYTHNNLHNFSYISIRNIRLI